MRAVKQVLLAVAFSTSAGAETTDPLIAPGCGRVEMTRCQAEIIGDSGAPSPIKPGLLICPGDRVSTGDGSRVRWLMAGGASIEILENTELESLAAGAWRLEKGGAVVMLPQRAKGEAPASGAESVRVETRFGRAVLHGSKAYTSIGLDGSFVTVAMRGEAQVEYAPPKTAVALEASSELRDDRKRKLSKRELRAIELSVRAPKPPAGRPSAGCPTSSN